MLKGAVVLPHSGDTTAPRCLTPLGHYTAEAKNSSPWYICDQSLHWVSAISVHYFWRYEHFTERHFQFSWSDFVAWSRNLWTTQMPCNDNNYSKYDRSSLKSFDQLEQELSIDIPPLVRNSISALAVQERRRYQASNSYVLSPLTTILYLLSVKNSGGL